MARIQIKGIDEYALKLSKLGNESRSVAGEAIYGAADIVSNQIRGNIGSLSTVTEVENIQAYRKKTKAGLSRRQKQGLLDSLGISKMKDDDGYLNVKIGFDEYNSIRTKKYPKGQPNQLIARVVENGSQYMDKEPFIRPALNRTRKAAQQKMQDTIDKRTKEIMG